jgi:DNA-binding LytR/AlgR family response regulator
MELLTQKTILIIEDEPLIANHIELVLIEANYLVLKKVRSAQEAIYQLENEKPDLILLDITIKGDTDGVELAYIINDKYKIPFIYLTSHFDDSTVNRLKKTKPAGFVLKPFNEKELLTQISIALYHSNNCKEVTSSEDNYIFVRYNNQWIKIPYSNICFARADDNYTLIHTPDKDYLLSYPLKKIEDSLPKSRFQRVHKSYVVNLERIESIIERIIIIKHHQIPVGRLYYDLLMLRINKL